MRNIENVEIKGSFKTLKEAFTSEEASTRGILPAIFFWFFGYNAVETFSRAMENGI